MSSSKSSFSLLEMLIYLSIVVVIGSILLNFTFSFLQSFSKTRVKREVLGNARLAMELMTADIKAANSVYSPTSTFGSNPGHLSMETLVNLPSEEKRTYFNYYASSSRLYFKRDGQNPVAITSESVKIDSLIFTYLQNGTTGAESVKIDIIIISATPSKEYLSATTTLTTTASVRGNY